MGKYEGRIGRNERWNEECEEARDEVIGDIVAVAHARNKELELLDFYEEDDPQWGMIAQRVEELDDVIEALRDEALYFDSVMGNA